MQLGFIKTVTRPVCRTSCWGIQQAGSAGHIWPPSLGEHLGGFIQTYPSCFWGYDGAILRNSWPKLVFQGESACCKYKCYEHITVLFHTRWPLPHPEASWCESKWTSLPRFFKGKQKQEISGRKAQPSFLCLVPSPSGSSNALGNPREHSGVSVADSGVAVITVVSKYKTIMIYNVWLKQADMRPYQNISLGLWYLPNSCPTYPNFILPMP